MAGEIKAVARALMHQRGTAGLTLRGIAREMGVTAPAIYHYYPSLDDLITALLVDAFIAEADAINSGVTAAAPEGLVQQLLAGMYAYRQWALAYPIEFQLIFGNPVPGYRAPEEVTTPLARRPFIEFGRVLMQLYAAGHLRASAAYVDVPPSIAAAIAELRARGELLLPSDLLYLMTVVWTRMHGMVSLELFGHLQPVVGDPEAFYRQQVAAFLSEMGLTL